ncbi:MAG TPA: gamma-glutamyltransferase [Kribbellaceae bacterium]|nr:gamma-glutamyltransferase [Kribbellaceae bacterium]
MPAGVAAGHPVTTEVGLRMLAAGGSAADAAVAATLSCCVAESILTGICGGGFATYYDAGTRTVTCLDFFCSVPGLDGDAKPGPMTPIEINFGGVPLPYSIGGASVGVPGVPLGAAEVHARWGRLSWQRVVEPAITLARSGVVLPAAQARTLGSVSPALLPGDGAHIYSPGGKLLEGGELLYHPGLDTALGLLAEQGPAAFYAGHIGQSIVKAVRAAGGVLGPVDLASYRVIELPVVHAAFAGRHVFARHDLNNTIRTIAELPTDFPSLRRGARARALADALYCTGRQKVGDTTNISVVDPDGNAYVVTLTLGIGSGVWLPGLGIHLNSMLGEGELLTPDLAPGRRMSSMMCPLVVVDDDGDLVVAAGSAGASRIRTALLHTLVNVLVDKQEMGAAVNRPRFHVVGEPGPPGAPERRIAHVEHGYPQAEVDGIAQGGYEISQWDEINHYFGGVSAVGLAGAAGDPRRGGVGLMA